MAMAHGDRMGLMIKNFGKTVVIDIRLGKPKWDERRKRLTIHYQDAPMRNPKSK